MATSLYFRDTPWGAGNEYAKWQTGTNDANLDGTAQSWNALRLSPTRGAAAASKTRTTSAGPTAGQEIGASNHWISAPLAADVTITGNITFNLRMAESVGTQNAGAQCVIERVNNLGQVVSTVINSEKGTELTVTTETAENWSATPTSTAFFKGDRIRVRVAANDAGGTLAVGTATFWMTGPTGGASGDSFITFTESVSFATSFPTPGTVIYPTDTSSDIDPGGASVDTKEAWDTRGAGTQTAVVNTAAGWTSTIQWTKTAGGNTVEWYTKQLQAFTLGGVVQVNFRGLESDALANVAPRCEIAVCDSAGAVVSTWGANTVNNELAITNTTHIIWNVAGRDRAVTDGQRLRIRFSIDDTESAAMATAFTATLGYAGTGAGTGDTYLTFAETLAEFSTAPAKPKSWRVGRPQAGNRASRW